MITKDDSVFSRGIYGFAFKNEKRWFMIKLWLGIIPSIFLLIEWFYLAQKRIEVFSSSPQTFLDYLFLPLILLPIFPILSLFYITFTRSSNSRIERYTNIFLYVGVLTFIALAQGIATKYSALAFPLPLILFFVLVSPVIVCALHSQKLEIEKSKPSEVHP